MRGAPEVGTTPFGQQCLAHGWGRSEDFLRAFETTAAILGEAVTLTDRQLRRWRQPSPPRPRARAWRVLYAMFGVSPAELGFPGPPPGVTVGDLPPATEEGRVDRRTFIADSFGVAAGGMPPMTPAGHSGAVGTTHLLELREGLRSLYQLDNSYGGGDVRSLALRHLRRIRRVLNTSSYPDTIGRQLQLLVGETAEHCAWLYYDAGDQHRARQYWGEALTTATVLPDASLEILVLASLSMQASYEGRPREGLDLARAAQKRAQQYDSPVLQSLIASREARALSLMADAQGASRRLADAMRLVERSRGRPSPEWAHFHGHAELDYAQGLLYTESGHHHAAVQFLRAALAHQDRTYGRNRALYRLTLSRSLVKSGEVEESAAHAVASLGHLEEVESGRVLRRLHEVADLLSGVDAVSAQQAAAELTEYAHMKGAA